MTSPPPADLDDILAVCLEAERLGVPLDRDELRRRRPDLAAELSEFLHGHDALRQLAPRPSPPADDDASQRTMQVGEDAILDDTACGDETDGCSRLGRYRLIRVLGRGGMGTVYEAWHEGLNRPAAVKVVSSGPFASEEELRRFKAEAEAAANLHHPNLVPIYEVDVCDGRPYYSMELVVGESLAELVARGPVPPGRAAELIAAVAGAVDYAHRRGILHRDLKPANVLIDTAGRPRVLDFGLAKRLPDGDLTDADGEPAAAHPTPDASSLRPRPSEMTRTGAILGTPSYMAPEQAAGAKSVGPAADIYGLGGILYCLLTGRPPHRGANPVETLQLVIDARPEPVTALNPGVPADLATIVQTCLEKAPRDRYRTAADLAADLNRFLAGDPITKEALSLWGRVTREVHRSRHEGHFRLWGRALIGFGFIVFLAHLTMHLLNRAGVTGLWAFVPPRLAMVAVLLATLRLARGHRSLLPADSVERLVWVVWIGYLLAYTAAAAATTVAGMPYAAVYPYCAALAGLGFFTLGCHVWGACYLVGVAFFVAAPLLALVPEYTVLGFGALWGLALLSLGLRYERLNRTLPAEETP